MMPSRLAAFVTIAALLLGASAASAQTPVQTSVQTPAPAAKPRAPGDTPEGGAWIACKVAEIAAFRDHFEFVCETAKGIDGGPPSTFSLERRDGSGDAFFTLAVEAKRSVRPLMILYVKSPQANPDDCPVETCRRLVAVRLK